MKFLVFLLVMGFTYSGHAADCEKLERWIVSFCQDGFSGKEDYLKKCLSRRDTCETSGRVQTQDRCGEIHSCMKEHQTSFKEVNGDNFKCEYYWDDKSQKCFIKRGFLSIVSQCPGRITLMDSLVGGFEGGIDGEFDCSAQAAMVKDTISRCQKTRDEYKAQCKETSAHLAKYTVPSSKYTDLTNRGQWRVNPGQQTHIDETGRNFIFEREQSAEESKESKAPAKSGAAR